MVTTRRGSARQSMPAAASAFASAFLGRMEALGDTGTPSPPSRRRHDHEVDRSSSSARSRRSSSRDVASDIVDVDADVDLTTRAATSTRAVRAANHQNLDRSLPVANIAALCAAATGAFLMLSLVLHCGIVAAGLVVPAWGTFKAVERRRGAASLERYGAFWILAALIFASDRLFLSKFLRPWLPGPGYDALMFVLVMWLSRNDGEKAEQVYDGYVAPVLLRYEDSLDSAMAALGDKVEDVARYGLVKVHDSVQPIAMQLEHAASCAAQEAERRQRQRRIVG